MQSVINSRYAASLMRIPIFLSSPSWKNLNPDQTEIRKLVEDQLRKLGLEPRSLGSSDYPKEYPLKEVLVIARQCSGGVILGFEQFRATRGSWKKAKSKVITKPVPFPSPWNNLEAGILFGLRLPLLIFKEENIEGGVFDHGVTDVFVHKMPPPGITLFRQAGLADVFLSWQTNVRKKYYKL
jgi:hypothetical protein